MKRTSILKYSLYTDYIADYKTVKRRQGNIWLMSIILTIILAKIISLYLAKTLQPESFYMTTLMNIKNTRERGAKKEKEFETIYIPG